MFRLMGKKIILYENKMFSSGSMDLLELALLHYVFFIHVEVYISNDTNPGTLESLLSTCH